MYSLIQLKNPTVVALLLACFGLVPLARAVLPAPSPDGGYPGGNTAEGQNALFSMTSGGYNTAVGFFSLRSVTTGSFNSGVGAGTLLANSGDQNTATGAGALLSNTIGTQNTATGAFAMFNNTTGAGNTALGDFALSNNTTGLVNTALGFGAGSGVTTANEVIAIGANGGNVDNSCFIGHIRDVATANNNAIPVLIDSAGQLGTMSSSRRFKHEIKPIDKASEAILALRPVTFHYKSDATNRPEFGLIAEEVAEVNPDLVVRDEDGETYTVRYDAVNAMLLNEFLKEHRRVQELESTLARQETSAARQQAAIAVQQKQIDALTAGLQKVSAQLELSKPARQTALNNQ
jgi:Chaperone of endosialidase